MSLDTAKLEHQLQLYKGLVEVSGVINEITESAELLPAVLDVARRVLNAEAATLLLVNAKGELELSAGRGGQAHLLEKEKVVVPRGRGVSGWVFEAGKPLLVPDAYRDDRFYPHFDRMTGYRTKAILCVPLVRRGKKIGVLQVLNPLNRAAFDQTDLEVSVAFANLAAGAIEKVRALEREREQQRVTQEFAFARDIQNSFLPQALPQRERLHFAAAYRPALNVGGDFYDVVETGPDEVYFVIGDVSGKGMPAALLMAQALSTLRSIIAPGIPPHTALQRWNSMVGGRGLRGIFITALLGRATVSERKVELVNAGHCAPLRVAAAGGAREVSLRGSPPLGILPQLNQEPLVLTLSEEEWLLLYTDGLVESFSPEEVILDRGGVAALLQPGFRSAPELIEALLAGEKSHRREAEPHDDLTLLTFGFR